MLSDHVIDSLYTFELLIDSGENFGDGSGVGDHAASSHALISSSFAGLAPHHFGLDNRAAKGSTKRGLGVSTADYTFYSDNILHLRVTDSILAMYFIFVLLKL